MLGENDKNVINSVILNTILSDDFDDEVKIGRIERFEDFGGDVKAQIFGKSMLVWAKENNIGEGIIKYLKNRGVKEEVISKEEADEKAKDFWNKNGKIKRVEEVKKLVYAGANLGDVVDGRNVFQNLGFEEINEVLKILPKGYVIDGDVDLFGKNLVELPDFSKVIVAGDFYCSSNQLTLLRGAPKEVGRSFWCKANQLTSLRGAPKKVGGGFDCYENQLTSLRGAPEKVGKYFDCCGNENLKSLDGMPKKIGGMFMCDKEVLEKIEKNKRDEMGNGEEMSKGDNVNKNDKKKGMNNFWGRLLGKNR